MNTISSDLRRELSKKICKDIVDIVGSYLKKYQGSHSDESGDRCNKLSILFFDSLDKYNDWIEYQSEINDANESLCGDFICQPKTIVLYRMISLGNASNTSSIMSRRVSTVDSFPRTVTVFTLGFPTRENQVWIANKIIQKHKRIHETLLTGDRIRVGCYRNFSNVLSLRAVWSDHGLQPHILDFNTVPCLYKSVTPHPHWMDVNHRHGSKLEGIVSNGTEKFSMGKFDLTEWKVIKKTSLVLPMTRPGELGQERMIHLYEITSPFTSVKWHFWSSKSQFEKVGTNSCNQCSRGQNSTIYFHYPTDPSFYDRQPITDDPVSKCIHDAIRGFKIKVENYFIHLDTLYC